MKTGHVILLNGTSSAGKTTLARALQDTLPDPWLHVALDQFRDGLPDRYRGLNAPAGTTGASGLNVVPVTRPDGTAYTDVRFGETGCTMLRGMRRAIRALADAGNNVVVDDILLEPGFLGDYLDVLHGIPVCFVGVRCDREVVNLRELQRPGRFPGTADGQFGPVHAHALYDVEVDTSTMTPGECAARVAAALDACHAGSAFQRLQEACR